MSSKRSVDVAVVGCGVIGASIAWRLSRAGATVAYVDPDPGGGATYAAAGMLAAATEAEFGEHELTRLNVESARAWPSFARELESESGLPTGLRRSGTLTVAYDSGDRQQLRRLLDLRRRWGLDVDEISTETARDMEPLLGPRISGATWAPGDHQVDPRLVHAALLKALTARQVAAVHRRAVSLTHAPDGRVTGVITDDGTRCDAATVVLAAGWNSRALTRDLPGIDVPTRPVKGQVLRLDAGAHGAVRLGRVIRGFVQARPVYLVPREHGELVVGATSEEQPDDRLVTAGGLFGVLRDARAVVPGIDELPVIDMVARARPGSPDNLPLIGPSGVDGLVLATGHYRNGILLAPATADAVVALHLSGRVPELVQAADPRRFATAGLIPSGGRS